MDVGLFMIIFIVLLTPLIIKSFKAFVKHYEQRDNYKQISLNMPEEDMLKIMGNRYNRSLLKNGRTKYEWRYSNGTSYGTYYKGMSFRSYSGVSKVDIYCKNGVVEEVRPYNC